MVIPGVWPYCLLFVPKFQCFFLVVLRLGYRECYIWSYLVFGPYSLLLVPKCRFFSLVVLKLAYRLLRMVIPRVWAVLPVICAKFSLFFASSLKVDL